MKSLKFHGSGFEYFKIWIVNILLTTVTLSLYYPWAKVRNKRYFYGNSFLEDRNFEYHATGKQLFFGYLIAMACLIVYLLIQQFSPGLSVIVFLILFFAIPWIIWRSLMFNLRMTSFSNVRFSFHGSLGGAYFNYLLLPILVLVAAYVIPIFIAIFGSMFSHSFNAVVGAIFAVAIGLGIVLAIYAYSVLKKNNYSYYIDSAKYGQGEFSTKLEVVPFFKIILKTVALFIICMFVYVFLIGILAALLGSADQLLSLAGNFEDPEAINDVLSNGLIVTLVLLVYAGFIAINFVVFGYSLARQRAYVLANSKLDNKIDLASTARARNLAWISLSNVLLIIVTLGLATPWAAVRMTRYLLENTHVDAQEGFDSYVSQQQEYQSSLGDQLGDAFDVDIGIGI